MSRAVDILATRRAVFVYEAARLAAIAAGAPVIPANWAERDLDFRDQFVDVIARQCGEDRFPSAEAAHASWVEAYEKMGWVYGDTYDAESRVHPDLVPFDELGQLERDKDYVFLALCDIARQWIYEDEGLERDAAREQEENPLNLAGDEWDDPIEQEAMAVELDARERGGGQ